MWLLSLVRGKAGSNLDLILTLLMAMKIPGDSVIVGNGLSLPTKMSTVRLSSESNESEQIPEGIQSKDPIILPIHHCDGTFKKIFILVCFELRD